MGRPTHNQTTMDYQIQRPVRSVRASEARICTFSLGCGVNHVGMKFGIDAGFIGDLGNSLLVAENAHPTPRASDIAPNIHL